MNRGAAAVVHEDIPTLEPTGRSGVTLPWWANPVSGMAIFALPGTLLAFATSADGFAELWGTPKHVGGGDVLRALVALVAFAVGFFWYCLVQRPSPSAVPRDVTDERLFSAFRLLSWLAFLSYGAWALLGLHRGVTIAQIRATITGAPGATFLFKQLMAPVAGITTFTQTAPVVAALAGLLIRRGHARSVAGPLALLGALACVRAYLFSERLVILEVGLPLVLAWLLAAQGPPPARSGSRLLWAVFPLLYVAVAASLFAALEYNRSWAYYRTVSDVSYSTFARERFLGYYTTSPNNAALVLQRSGGPRPKPFTTQWLDEFPLLNRVVDLYGDRVPMTDVLATGGNPEFNTEGALFAPTIDWGPWGSLVVWFVGGAAFAFVFERVRRGHDAFLPVYATAYIGILESGRYFYWGLGRTVVPLGIGLLVVRHLGRSPQPDGRISSARGSTEARSGTTPAEASQANRVTAR